MSLPNTPLPSNYDKTPTIQVPGLKRGQAGEPCWATWAHTLSNAPGFRVW